MPSVYTITIATSLAGLAVPMSLAPATFKRTLPDRVITAARTRVLNGLAGYDLFWTVTHPADFADILSRTGGAGASSIPGYIRIIDWIPRASNQETWSDYSCILDQPIEGEFRQGSNRYNLLVSARELVRAVELAL